MKNPELPSPTPTPRPYVPRIVEPLAAGFEREEKFQPRYVEVPALREHGFGRRNLAWGVLTLTVALTLLVAAIIVSGQKAVLSLAACLCTFTALFVLARLHVFRQRNGGFLAAAVVVLLGAIVPLIDRGYELLAGVSQPPAAAAAPSAVTAARPVEIEPPLLTQSFALAKPDPAFPQVKVLKDSRVVIGEKPFLIRAGDTFPLLEAKAGEATFAVRDLHVSLPVAVVEILGGKAAKGSREVVKESPEPVKETREAAVAAALAAVGSGEAVKPEPSKPALDAAKPEATANAELAAITQSAKVEATRRYPALAIKDSAENEAFITAYHQYKDDGNTDFFANPEWPLELAETLATRHGWARGDRPAPPAAPAAPTMEPPFEDEGSANFEPVKAAAPVRSQTKPAQLALPRAEELPRIPRLR